MSITEKINKVLEAEGQAEAILREAEAKAEAMRVEALAGARSAEEEARKNAALRIDELWAESGADCDRAITEIDRRAEALAASLKEEAEPKLPAAAALTVDRVTGAE